MGIIRRRYRSHASHRNLHPSSRRNGQIAHLVAVCLVVIPVVGNFGLTEAKAQQQGATSQGSPEAAATEDNNGQDFTRPENLFQYRYLYQTAPGSGSERGTIREVTTDSLTLRTDVTVDLASQWKFVVRGDLPIVAKNPITSDNPDGEFVQGLGDADLQGAIIHDFDARWAAGAGLRLVAPTGEEDITSGKWQALPIAGVRYMLPELSQGSYAIALFRYDMSFAGDAAKKNISNLQFAPELNISLPDHWFVTLYPSPDIRINYGDAITGQTGRLFLPADFLIGRNITKTMTVSLEFGVPIVKDYPVYNFKSEVRLNLKF
jgi:hypothetical protein